ncbi:MAG TPA: GNAT family N-acetyltransferase [Acidimicrobiales bacterium]|nr:GNAT family N-acetyltransferase [Acidimicrobiales bacterium]
MLEIGEPAAEHADGLAAVAAISFNYTPRPESISLDGALCAFDDGKVVAICRALPFGQWWGGARVPCAGVAGVAVLPEYRGRGLAGRLMRQLLEARRAAGDAVSALYPANAPLYRQHGYEFAGLYTELTVPVVDLPPSRAEVRLLEEGELADLMACYSTYASRHNGPVETADAERWKEHILAHKDEGTHQRTVVAPGEAGVEGYASYFLGNWESRGYPVVSKHLVALTPGALGALLGYFRRFEGSASTFTWRGSPSTAPVGIAAGSDGFSVVPKLRRWMLRVLDVPLALERRGYQSASGEVVIEIEDPMFPANAGAWRLRVENGRAQAAKLSEEVRAPVPIGLFSALYAGLVAPWDLVLLGALAPDEPRLGELSRLFAGPVAWMPDFF